MRRFLPRLTAAVLVAAAIFPGLAVGQTTVAKTKPTPILVTAGNTYQQILAAVVSNGDRRSLTIQNNNASDSCYLLIGGPWVAGDTTATTRTPDGGVLISAIKGSVSLLPGGSYTRYAPYIPSDQILGTCTTTADSIYVDTQ